MTQDNTTTWRGRRVTRRQALRYAARAGIGVVGLSLAACAAPAAPTPAPTKAPGAPAATPTRPPAATPTPAAKRLESLTTGYPRDLTGLDSNMVGGLDTNTFFDMLYDGLVELGRDLSFIPGLATSWKVTEDPKTWEFKLRPGITFHNGEEFDADTVKFNADRIQDPKYKSYHASAWADVTEVKPVDKMTVRITTKAPNPTVPLKLILAKMMPRKYIQDKGDDIMKTAPLGTGPYKFVQWKKDEYVELAAVDKHWQAGVPPAKKYIQRVIPEMAPRVAALQTGLVDIIWDPAAEFLKTLKDDPNLEVIPSTGVSVPHVAISQFKEGPLRDKRVRQALNYAVDKESIVKNLFLGIYVPVGQPLVPACFGYDTTIKPYPYDPKKAKELLAQAGYPNGFEVVFDLPKVAYPKYNEYTQAIANYLAEVGVKTTLRPQEQGYDREVRALGKGPEGLFHESPGCTDLDADRVAWAGFHSYDEAKRVGNYMYLTDPILDKFLDQARATMNPEERKKVYAQALKIINEEAYAIFLWDMPYSIVYNKKKIKKLHPRAFLLHPWDIEVA
ncbi:MAG: hypothetical protein HYU86_07580 [Chloroflexi bacterium]|nr:hypothetical protein [Chloroflexota bacterium]